MPHPVHGRGVHPALRLGAVAAVRVEQHLGGVVVREKPRSHGVYAQFRVEITGEVRGAGRMEKRAAECARLGYERLIIPRHAAFKAPSGIELIRVGTLAEAVKVLTQGRK